MRRNRNNPRSARVASVLPQGRARRRTCSCGDNAIGGAPAMNNIIYIVGLIVVVLAILSFLGLR